MGRKGADGRAAPIDTHVGGCIRRRRIAQGLTQQQLGARLGVTFQQIDKYERGEASIASWRLALIAKVLHVTVGYFFQGLPS